MYLMYVDESGDTGLNNSPTQYYILSAMVFHELRWQTLLNDLIEFRRVLKTKTGLKIREEIHAQDFISSPGELMRIKRNDRADILKKCIDWISAHTEISVITIVINKNGKPADIDIFEMAWKSLIQRFENTLEHHNFPGPANPEDRGLIFPDNTDGKKLVKLLRQMRRYNPIPNDLSIYSGGSRNKTLNLIIEDPVLRNSRDSLFIQMVDVIAYTAKQLYQPNKYMKKGGRHNYYKRLDPVLNKFVTKKNVLGIVEL